MANSASLLSPSPGPEYILSQKCSIDDFISDYGQMTTVEVAAKYGVAEATVDLYAQRLRESGYNVTSHRPKVQADDFVESWNASESLEEMAARAGVNGRSRRSLSAKASQYRSLGYDLKYMSNQTKT